MSSFKQKINERDCQVGIIGLGYVGVPLAIRVSEVGMPVLGFDIDQNLIDELNVGKSSIKHIPDSSIQAMIDKKFQATTDFSLVEKCDVLVICVPTPLNKSREPDLSYVVATMKQMQPHFCKDQLLCLESTTWPGTTEEVLKPLVLDAGLSPGEDFYLAYSPEREDPGNPHFSTKTIPKVVGGLTPECLDRAKYFYSQFIDTVVPVSSASAAEMVKLLENIHRSVNIGLVNEMKVVADAMGLDIFEIIDAAKTKPFGFTAYYPGPGIGGHCIPIDPFYLTWKAREYGIHTRFIELAGEINASMPQYVVDKTINGLNAVSKSLKGSKVLILGLAYKSNVDDCRESPSILIMEILRDWGADVQYSDPYVSVFPEMRNHKFLLQSVKLTPSVISSYDAVLLLTNHESFDHQMIGENAKLLIDTRGHYKNLDNVIRA
jgi:UDP-N-acetyl-D-glucosamine dehydrogenase